MKNSYYLLIIGITALLVSCGGSSSIDPVSVSPPTPPSPVGGIIGSGIAFGPVSGFGSIIVNGVRYDTSSATFSIDDGAGTEADLKVGQVVTVKAETDDQGNTNATEVIFDNEVEGPIESIDLVANSLFVLGQLVLVDTNTSFDDSITTASLEGLSVGDVIEVSGLINSNGAIVATRIELKTGAVEFEVHGTVSALDSGAQTFMLNALLIDFSNATLQDFGVSSLANGDLVEVKGINFATGGEFIATSVELESLNDRIGNNDDSGEIEGLITSFTSVESFSVANVPVITNSSTVFEDGVAADLALNVRVEAEGNFDANGVLVADKIEFEQESNVRIVATLDSLNATNTSITLLGIEFLTDTSTRFEDKSDADIESFSFSNLSAGDYVETRGYTSAGALIASRVERDDFDTDIEIQGVIEVVGLNSVGILGINIATNAATTYRDFDNSLLTQTEFFNLLSVGSLVKAQGTNFSGNSLLAEELSFEN